MRYDAATKIVNFEVDFQYAGGPFTVDDSANPVDVSTLFAAPDLFDANDYTVWRDTLGSTTDLRANWDNTGTSMDVIDQADYEFWKSHFGLVEGEGWPGEPSRIFFGGDDSVIFKDFSVTVAPGAGHSAVWPLFRSRHRCC